MVFADSSICRLENLIFFFATIMHIHNTLSVSLSHSLPIEMHATLPSLSLSLFSIDLCVGIVYLDLLPLFFNLSLPLLFLIFRGLPFSFFFFYSPFCGIFAQMSALFVATQNDYNFLLCGL